MPLILIWTNSANEMHHSSVYTIYSDYSEFDSTAFSLRREIVMVLLARVRFR